jgi:molecular chaperone GrpE
MDLEAELETALTSYDDLKDKYLRKAAEFENYKKSIAADRERVVTETKKEVMLDLLPFLDDIDRAIRLHIDYKSLFDGINLACKNFSKTTQKWGLERYITKGEPFDPNIHEAVEVLKSKTVADAKVCEEFVQGYMLNDKILRTAKVIVVLPEE